MFKSIRPEVAGGFGKETKLDTKVHPPIVYQLHYEFQGWLRNDILTTFPCFIVTENLKESILKTGLSGVIFDDVKITTTIVHRPSPSEIQLDESIWTSWERRFWDFWRISTNSIRRSL